MLLIVFNDTVFADETVNLVCDPFPPFVIGKEGQKTSNLKGIKPLDQNTVSKAIKRVLNE